MSAATATKETAAAKALNQEVVNMAEAIKADLKIDDSTGLATVGKDLYARLLPESLSPETVEQVQQHTAKFGAAAALALGESAIPVMKKNKDLNHVSLQVQATSRDAFVVNFERSTQVSAGIPEKGQPMQKRDKFGHTTVEFKMLGNNRRADLKAVFDHLENKAAKALAGK